MNDYYNKKYAFVDEYGDAGLDFNKANTSTHFIVTAIIIDESNLSIAEQRINEIREKYFQGSEIKSSHVKNKHVDRRVFILNKLMEIPFSILSVVIDKRQLHSEGFSYHYSFMKFCNSLVYNQLYQTFPNLKVVADKHGDNKYIQSFIKYVIANQRINDLFNQSTFEFDDSSSISLIQIADFIGGSLAKGFDAKYDTSIAKSFFDIFRDRIVLKEWPKEKPTYTFTPSRYSAFDETIAEFSIKIAQDYIDSNCMSKDQNVICRINCLRYLLFNFRYIEPDKYIPTKQLMSVIKKQIGINLSEQTFRSEIIAQLRDEGIIIASSDKGYKIPMNVGDIYDFVKTSNRVIMPLIHRISLARDRILLVTQNKVDILNNQEFSDLQGLLN